MNIIYSQSNFDNNQIQNHYIELSNYLKLTDVTEERNKIQKRDKKIVPFGRRRRQER